MNILKKIDWKDIGYRVAKTFAQGVLSFLIANAANITKKTVIAAIMGAVCLAWNTGWAAVKPSLKIWYDSLFADERSAD